MKIGQVLSTVDFTASPRASARSSSARSQRCATRSRRCRSSGCEKLLREELGGPLERGVRGVRARGVRRRLDRPGPPRGHARRARRRGQGPVPGRRRGGRDRPAQPAVLLPLVSGWRPGWTSRRSPPSCASGSPRSSTTRSRRRTTRGRARLPRAPARVRPAGRHDAVDAAACSSPSWSRAGASRGQALGEAERDRFAEIVFRFFFGTLDPPAPRRRRPAPRQLPAARRRPRRLPGLRADARASTPTTSSGSARSRGRRRPGTRTACTPRWPRSATCPTRARSSPRRAGADPHRGRVVLHAGLPATLARVRRRRRWSGLLAALGLLRGDAPGDRAAAGAADPAHGGALLAVLGELRAGADWGALGARVLRRRAAVDAARRGGRRVLDDDALAGRRRA